VYPIIVVQDATARTGAWVMTLYRLNPMVRFVEAYQDCLYHLRFPTLANMAYLVGCAVVALVVGMAMFARLEPKLAEEL
jgi:ABC-2 type transport system permease protein